MYNYPMIRPALLLTLILVVFLTDCAEPKAPAASPQATPAALTVTSPAFANGSPIPQKYACQGDDLSPALAFSAPPAGAKSLALLVDDPDAPGGTWTHWIVYNLPAIQRSFRRAHRGRKASRRSFPRARCKARTASTGAITAVPAHLRGCTITTSGSMPSIRPYPPIRPWTVLVCLKQSMVTLSPRAR